jgi:hypothetical protein
MPKKRSNEHEAVEEENLTGEGVLDYGTALVYGRNDYSPKVRTIIKQYGMKIINSLTIMRHPIQQAIVELLNMFSFGSFKKNMSKTPYDKLFHLSLIIQFTDGTVIKAEKNEVINLTNAITVPIDAETKHVDNMRPGIMLNTLLDGAKKIQGPNFFTYSAYNNNCQYFVTALLKGSSLGSEKDFTFIKQNTEQLFDANPSLIGISDKVTNMGATLDVLTHGAGLKQNKKLNIKDSKTKNSKNDIKYMSESKLIEAIGKLDKIIKKHTKMYGGSVNLNSALRNMNGGDLLHIDVNSHNSSGKSKMSGGALENKATVRHTGLRSSTEVPDFKSTLMTKTLKSSNKLLNNISSSDVEALKTLLGSVTEEDSEKGKKISKLEAKRIGAEIALIGGKQRLVKQPAKSGYERVTRGRMVKGSPEAKEWAKRMMELRRHKNN